MVKKQKVVDSIPVNYTMELHPECFGEMETHLEVCGCQFYDDCYSATVIRIEFNEMYHK